MGSSRQETGQTVNCKNSSPAWGIVFPLTHRSHSHCPCWCTQTPDPHPAAGCAWEPPPAGLTGRPGSDQLHTTRSQSMSQSGSKPKHRATVRSQTRDAVHMTDWQFILWLLCLKCLKGIWLASQSDRDFPFVKHKWRAFMNLHWLQCLWFSLTTRETSVTPLQFKT